MGRRAADLTTPVPVLGVPATVGVRSWKMTGEDRSGGALLQTWGQCTIGIQTSPGISRTPIQLPDSLSNNILQTTDSFITKETKAVSLHIKNDKEKGNISRLKTEETKIKKEVTFKAFGAVTSNDVAAFQKRSGGTYCYARAIKTNPLIAGTTSNRLKPSSRYINGSVVDSEAIGGISVVNDDTEPLNAASSHNRDLHHPYTDQSLKMQSLSLAMVRKMYNYGGEKQSVMSRGNILGQNSPISDTIFGEKPSKPALTSLFTASHTLPHILKQNHLNSQTRSVKKTKTCDPHLLYLNKEPRCRQTPHPACPVHSRGSLANLFHAHTSSDITSIKPEATLNGKALIVAEATNKSRQEKCTINCVTNSMQENKIPLLNFTPLMATAIKTFQTSPKGLKTSPCNSLLDNIPQNVSVSVHTAPKSPDLSLNPVATGTKRTSSAVPQKTFNLETTSTTCNLSAQQKTLNSTHMAQIFKSEPSSNLTLIGSPPDLYICKEKPSISAVSASPDKKYFIDNEAQFPASVNPAQEPALHSFQSAAVPKIPLNHEVNPDQITCKSSIDKAVPSQIHSAQFTFSNCNPALHISTSSSNKIPGVSKSPDCGPESPVANIASHSTESKNTACRSIKPELKKTTFQASSLLTPSREMGGSTAASSASLLKLTETNEVQWNNEPSDKNKAHHTQEPDVKSKDSIKPCVQVVFPNQQSNSLTTLQNMSESVNRGSDAKTYRTSPPITPTTELQFDDSQFRDNAINQFAMHECKERDNTKCSHITKRQNSFSQMKPSTFNFWANPDREQQRQHYQGHMEADRHNATIPPGRTTRDSDSNAQQFALSAVNSHADVKCESSLDRQKHPGYFSHPVIAQANGDSTFSKTNTQVNPITQSTDCQISHFDIKLQRQNYTIPERSVSVPATLTTERGLPLHTAPEWELPSKSCPPLQSREVEAIRRLDLKFSPRAPQSGPGGSKLFHSHPSDVALLLPPSPQCCSSAGLEQRLRSVEDSLAANKDRITTLLNIIQDLETCNSPNSLLRCCKSGLDLKNCSTCQKTACIMYSVEYDFRQQERHFMEVLNYSPTERNSFSAHQAERSNLGPLRNVFFKNFTKTKLKSKKLCKTLFKWIPRKIHQV
ncbi:PREDICTED: uncharacterized protein LOC107082569 [Cyprinodon variegatus]|uniref:uncharacterized protein LOC107082569 n=1 Tax=Cyprinodon variegatus TaxID=28743 RepID=UPI000742A128|nr:PREDICTED: uncharacterized protein LOC107082569 [Cyprinodon variegatus]